MVDAGVAAIMHVSVTDAECLVNGHVCGGVAEALGVQAVHVQAFLDTGSALPIFAERVGMTPAAAEDLGMRLGKKGRIGLILGMLLER
ncbi:MAG TPA: hypothetical protein VL990_09165 [Acidobacteriaceae bacterium]|nr:hypothetical protein [Acidobacteriaceae bacterium]